MKTVTYEEIDVLKVITGIDRRLVDQQTTLINIQPFLKASPEYAQLRMAEMELKNIPPMRKFKQPKNEKEAVEIGQQIRADKQRYYQKKQAATEKVAKASVDFKATFKKAKKQNRKYFELRKNELDLTPELLTTITGKPDAKMKDLEKKLKKLDKNQFLTLDGQVLYNLTGERYWIDNDGAWTLGTIEKIGDELPDGAIPEKELTSEDRTKIVEYQQLEAIKNLTPEQRSDKITEEINAAASRLAVQRSADEIQGIDPETALRVAQEKFELDKKSIEQKYSV
jgi:hypothetical protein